MAHLGCIESREWIEEEIFKRVNKWVDERKRACKKKKCKWWMLCLNKLFCWFVVYTVLVVSWVVEKVGKWVIHTVCEVLANIRDAVAMVIDGLIDVFAGLFTGDWTRFFDGWLKMLGAVEPGLNLLRILTLVDTLKFFGDEYDRYLMRQHVRELLEQKYSGEELEQIKEALGVDYGAFGFRIASRAVRTYVRSDFRSTRVGPADLIRWHADPTTGIDLKELAGYTHSEFRNRSRPEVVADTGGFSEDDLDEYISTMGVQGKPFSIFCMSRATLQTKLNAASEKGRELGLMLQWRVEDIQVKEARDVRHVEAPTDEPRPISLIDFLKRVLGRRLKSEDPVGAQEDLCTVTVAGIFKYTHKLNGLSVHLETATCAEARRRPFVGNGASGVTFRDRFPPDAGWKYVPIHEIGHYFGLCHVDSISRIMYSPAEKDWWQAGTIPELYFNGGPSFRLNEAESVWSYIIEHFPSSCLKVRA